MTHRVSLLPISDSSVVVRLGVQSDCKPWRFPIAPTLDSSRSIPGLVGQFYADTRRWDVIAQDADVDPEALVQKAA